MEYRILVLAYGPSAKSKGVISGRAFPTNQRRPEGIEEFAINASDLDMAFEHVSRLFRPTDKRPLAGKSYLRSCALKPRKLGAQVKLAVPYASFPGIDPGYRTGVVTEVVNQQVVSVGLYRTNTETGEVEKYRTQFVDFNLSELL